MLAWLQLFVRTKQIIELLPYTPEPPLNGKLTYIPSYVPPGQAPARSKKSLSKRIREFLAKKAWGHVYIVAEASLPFDPFLPVKRQLYGVENGEACRPFEFPALGVLVYPHMSGEELHFTDLVKKPLALQAIDDRWGTSISRHFQQCSLGHYCQPFTIFRSTEHAPHMTCLTCILSELSVYDYQASHDLL